MTSNFESPPNVDQQPQSKLKIHIHEKIFQQQQENGLRHDDFHRYTQYCTGRLARLRDTLKFKNGKGKNFTKKDFPDVIDDNRYLEIVLVDAERSWSYGVALKTLFALNDENTRPRLHAVRKFAKSLLHAKKLEEMCKEFATDETIMEATAYRLVAESRVAAEKENYTQAISLAEQARNLYETLARIDNVLSADALQLYHHPAKVFNLDSLSTAIRSYKWAVPSHSQNDSEAPTSDTTAQLHSVKGVTFKGSELRVPTETAVSIIHSAIEARRTVADSEQIMTCQASAHQVLELFDDVEKISSVASTALHGEFLLSTKSENSSTSNKWVTVQDFLKVLHQTAALDRELALLATVVRRIELSIINSGSLNGLVKSETQLINLKKSASQKKKKVNQKNIDNNNSNIASEISIVDAIRLCDHAETRLKALAELAGVNPLSEAPNTKEGGIKRIQIAKDKTQAESIFRSIARHALYYLRMLLLAISHAANNKNSLTYTLAHSSRSRIAESKSLGTSTAIESVISICGGQQDFSSVSLSAQLVSAVEHLTQNVALRVEILSGLEITKQKQNKINA